MVSLQTFETVLASYYITSLGVITIKLLIQVSISLLWKNL